MTCLFLSESGFFLKHETGVRAETFLHLIDLCLLSGRYTEFILNLKKNSLKWQ